MNLYRKIIITAAVIIFFAVATGVYLFQINPPKEITRLTWERTGGFMGLNEELVINSNGSASYLSNYFGNGNVILTEAELEEVMSLVERVDFPSSEGGYPAKPGVADFFSYSLTVQTSSGTKTVKWVDEWASAKPLPSGLVEVQNYIQTIIVKIRESTIPGEGGDVVVKMAIGFIAQAPTFKYDGIQGTLKVIDSKVLLSFPEQYVISITFNSGHAGYGNREGQVLAQVITPHVAVVKIVNDNVISAILDNQWDELHQKPIP